MAVESWNKRVENLRLKLCQEIFFAVFLSSQRDREKMTSFHSLRGKRTKYPQ